VTTEGLSPGVSPRFVLKISILVRLSAEKGMVWVRGKGSLARVTESSAMALVEFDSLNKTGGAADAPADRFDNKRGAAAERMRSALMKRPVGAGIVRLENVRVFITDPSPPLT
jgi:hypothetical protein